MAQGKVSVIDRNLDQTTPAGVERKALFIGTDVLASVTKDQMLAVNSKSNIDELLGNRGSLREQVLAAQRNGGNDWFAYVYPASSLANMNAIIDQKSAELVVITDAVAATGLAAFFGNAKGLANYQLQTNARRIAVLFSVEAVAAAATWAAHKTALVNAVSGLEGYRVAVVPLVHGNDLGCLVGRLCRADVSIADSPMRTATGAVTGLGDAIEDTDGNTISSAELAELDEAGFTCTQTYPDYPGVYFGDCNLFDKPTGDFQVIEYLRPLDKAARAVRLLAIAKVANREFNSTPESTEAHKTYFAKPLREMAQTKTVGNAVLPGDILPPKADAVTIVWTSKTAVEIYLKVQPYNSPKEIKAFIALDLSN